MGLLWPRTSGLPSNTLSHVPPDAFAAFPEMGPTTRGRKKPSPAPSRLLCHGWGRRSRPITAPSDFPPRALILAGVPTASFSGHPAQMEKTGRLWALVGAVTSSQPLLPPQAPWPVPASEPERGPPGGPSTMSPGRSPEESPERNTRRRGWKPKVRNGGGQASLQAGSVGRMGRGAW